MRYIYEYDAWPEFTWDDKKVSLILGKVRHLQGRVFGKMGALGFSLKEETMLSTLTLDVLKSSEIEGEILNYEQVRSSIARRLGIEYAGIVHVDRNVEGIVEMMLDATQKYKDPLLEERIFGWHAALFPTGWSGVECTALILVATEMEKCRLYLERWVKRRFTIKPLRLKW